MIYCFTNEARTETVERHYPMGRAPSRIRVKGAPFWRDLRAEHCGQCSGDAWTDHWSESMGARTAQHGREIAARCLKAGVSVRFKYGGCGPIEVKSRRHQRQLLAVAHANVGKMVNFDDC